MKIVIDPGHGGKDSGAIGHGMKESRINLNVALKLAELLRVAGHTVILIRSDDTFVELNSRSVTANKAKADLLVSIHHNAGGGDGFEIIYQMTSGQSAKLSKCIGAEFEKLNNKRKIYYKASEKYPKLDYFAILRQTKCPSVITEFAFLDTDDAKVVDTLTEQWEQSKAIFNGIQSYSNLI